MADFPALEVMMVGGHGPPAGTRLPITELPLRIGRSPSAASAPVGLPPKGGLVFPSPQLARNHAEVVFEYGRWWVRDLGSTNGTFFRGERIHDAELKHGDCFELAHGLVFRLLLHEPVELLEPTLERALHAQPDAPEPWSVYADWLQEQGDPLGERIATPRTEDDLQWQEPFAGLAARGDVEVAWAHGLPSRVVLRALTGVRPQLTWEQRLATLLRQRTYRFVRHLELDVGSFQVEAQTPRWGQRALYAIGPDALPLLERLVIGPCTLKLTAEERQVIDEALAARRARWPGFVTRPDDLFRPWGPARLISSTEGTRPLDPRGTAFGAQAFVVSFTEDRWELVAGAQRARVNGQATTRAVLRPGDRIEATDGLTFRFEA